MTEASVQSTEELSDAEITEEISNQLMRQMHQSSALRYLIKDLPDALLDAVGLHKQMMQLMSEYQQICFLQHLWLSNDLLPFLKYPLSLGVSEFLWEIRDRDDFRIFRDYSWDQNFDRPRDPLTFTPERTKQGNMKTVISRRGWTGVPAECYADYPQEMRSLLRLTNQNSGESMYPDTIEIEVEECITPLEDFCFPPDATVTIGYRPDGRIDFKVFAKEMPRSPVLHWVFPDPKRDDLDPAYRDFLWWL